MGSSRGHLLAREAEAWLRENLTEPLTIPDLCLAVNASERTLHSAFREHLGTTPKLHLKALRLAAAHDELRRAMGGTRISDVALRWGFLHFGWFSHDYRQFFGETPSATLRRRGLAPLQQAPAEASSARGASRRGASVAA
jgi:transcriptional regulator GlxA family with amidase domain